MTDNIIRAGIVALADARYPNQTPWITTVTPTRGLTALLEDFPDLYPVSEVQWVDVELKPLAPRSLMAQIEWMMNEARDKAIATAEQDVARRCEALKRHYDQLKESINDL